MKVPDAAKDFTPSRFAAWVPTPPAERTVCPLSPDASER